MKTEGATRKTVNTVAVLRSRKHSAPGWLLFMVWSSSLHLSHTAHGEERYPIVVNPLRKPWFVHERR